MTEEQQKNELFEELILKLNDIMPLPVTVKKIIELTRDPNTELKDLVVVLEKDQAMVSKILKLANSSYYGFSKQIKTISHAVVCLGYNTIKNMALAVSTYSMFDKSIVSYALEKGALFKHSYAVAIGSRIIAKKVKHINPEEVYVMGLLHDIGKIILDQYAKDKFIDVIRLFRKGSITFLAAEEQVLGFNHGEIGAKIAEKWNLSDELIESIRYHHHPQNASPENVSVHMVHIADVVVEMMGLGLGYDGLNYELCPDSMTRLGLEGADMESLMIQIMDELKTDSLEIPGAEQ
ncbi:MAG: HDOD domain-containing protein [Candidatus Margulisbacteria bacterium]|nr:HDOD domain-containing protein [Candidatus Margulisiibacteriota bacterium]